MQRGIGRLRARSSGGDADVSAWLAAVALNSGTVSAGTTAAVTVFVASAKASGYWTKLNRINLFCGDQLAAAMVPVKVGGGSATETNMNFVGGDYTEATGLTGNGSSKYLKTGLIPSVSLTLNDTHLAVYNRSSSADFTMGVSGTSVNSFELLAPFVGSVFSDQYGDGAGVGRVSAAQVAPYGFQIGSRTASNSHAVYRNGSSLASNAGSGGALPAIEPYIFARNTAGVAGSFSSAPIAAYSIGSGLTAGDVTAYNTHMQTFQTALARNV